MLLNQASKARGFKISFFMPPWSLFQNAKSKHVNFRWKEIADLRPSIGENMHKPVLYREILDLWKNSPHDAHFLDATFGRGGHTSAILDHFPHARVTAMDRDPEAIMHGQKYRNIYGPRFSILDGSFTSIASEIPLKSCDGILFDLGVSSPQLDCPARGFSFMKDGPLDMRMDPRYGLPASTYINTLPEDQLADIFFLYAGERASRRIARAIAYDRKTMPFVSTHQLAGLIERIVPRNRHHHPATKVFQALRIMVNNELDEIEKTLPMAQQSLKSGGILAIISFHSLEDRIIKTFFKNQVLSFKTIIKKPIQPQQDEIAENPRSRSACLRYGVMPS